VSAHSSSQTSSVPGGRYGGSWNGSARLLNLRPPGSKTEVRCVLDSVTFPCGTVYSAGRLPCHTTECWRQQISQVMSMCARDASRAHHSLARTRLMRKPLLSEAGINVRVGRPSQLEHGMPWLVVCVNAQAQLSDAGVWGSSVGLLGILGATFAWLQPAALTRGCRAGQLRDLPALPDRCPPTHIAGGSCNISSREPQ
jgi:hypothetical protein